MLLKSLNLKCFIATLTVLLVFSCENARQNIRIISDKDTTFSVDIRMLSKKISNEPQNADLYFKRANTFFFESNFKEALIDIDYAIVLDSLNSVYHFNKGKYLMSGDSVDAKQAEKSYKKALNIKPEYFDANFALAYLYLAKQDYVLSEQQYIKASKAEPSNPNPIFYLGMIAKETKDTARAIAYFEKTLVLDDKHYDALMQLGLYYANKNDSKGLLFLDKALSVNEYSDEALYAKGLYFQGQNKTKEAIIMYESVARLNASHIFCRYNLGVIFAIQSEYDKAIKYLDQAIDLDETYADAFTLRGKIFEVKKDITKAKADYQKAFDLDKNQTIAEQGLNRLKNSN